METTIEFPIPTTFIHPPTEPKPDVPHAPAFWDDFEAFYAKHGKLVEQCSNVDMATILRGENRAAAEKWIATYTETVKIMLSGLATLGKIHPVISVAVEAFGSVVLLDLARRENDKKVTIIRVAMQNMMCTMFRLRRLRDPADATETRSDLQHLVEKIKEDIKKCSGDLSGYTNQKTFSRIITSKIYKDRFKGHLDNFAENRSALHFAITTYIASGVEQANLQLSRLTTQDDLIQAKLDSINAKVDIFQQFLCTPKEWEALRFIAKHTIDACIEQDELLQKLLALAGDDLIDNEKGSKGDPLERIMTSAREQAKKDMAATTEENRERFDKILMLQKINHEQIFERLNVYEMNQQTTTSKLDKLLYIMNPDVKLTDPDLQRVWKFMGYKTIAKAKHFVLTFRDHYQYAQSLPLTPTSPQGGGPPMLQMDQSYNQSSNLAIPTTENGPESSTADDPNAWLLEYLDVAHVRPIVEAMDIDGSGFISVEELNLFAHSRPKDWSLLEWMVYWAAGWHLNTVGYREKIYDILVSMHEAIPALHPANSVLVAKYLDSYPMRCVEGLLRFTQDVQDKRSSQLSELAASYAHIEETNLKSKLEAATYILGSDADAILVGGAGRPESWLYPLLYLVLERHLAIINLARSHILNSDEMITHQKTVNSMITVLHQRKDTLQAIFSQLSQSVESRFETFARGMFYASYNSDDEIVPVKDTLFSKARTKRASQDIILELPSDMAKLAHLSDVSIMAHGKGMPFDFDHTNIFDIPEYDPAAHPLNGYWSCVYYNDAGEIQGTFHYLLHVGADGTISGPRESWAGLSQVSGIVQSSLDGTPMALQLDYILNDRHYYIKGLYDPVKDAITAELELQVPASQPTPLSSNAADTPDPIAGGVLRPEVEQSELSSQAASAQGLENQNHSPKYEQEELPDLGGKDEQVDPDIPCVNGAEQQDVGHPANKPEQGVGDIQDPGDAPNMEDEEEEKEEHLRLHMTRTRVDVVHLRHYLSSENPAFPRPIPGPARRRWFFAIDAMKHLIRAQRMPWSYVKSKFAERRLYLDLALRGSTGLMTIDDLELLLRLMKDLPPSQTRLYEAAARFLSDRSYAFRTGWTIYCDACGDPIICQRYRCITCVSDDFSNQIDLCTDNPSCISSPSSNERENFVHDPSHSLLRQKHYIYSCELSTLIPQCRALSDSVKKNFRSLAEERRAAEEKRTAKKSVKKKREAESLQQPPQVQEPTVQPMHCACCNAEATLPCWICVTCDFETVICLDCEQTNAEVEAVYEGQSKMHWHNHILLRINDSKEVQSGEVNNAKLQQELQKISSDVHALEGKVTAHLKNANQWIKASGEAPAEGFDDFESDFGPQSDDSEPIFIAIDPPAGLSNDAFEASSLAPNDDTQRDKIPSALSNETPSTGQTYLNVTPTITPPTAEVKGTHGIVHVNPSPESTPSSAPPEESGSIPKVAHHLASLDAGLSALQTRVASLDSRMSGIEASLSRLSRVENQLSELISLLSQPGAR